MMPLTMCVDVVTADSQTTAGHDTSWPASDVFMCHGLSQPVILMMPLTMCVDVVTADSQTTAGHDIS
jgi:hypothetical protein